MSCISGIAPSGISRKTPQCYIRAEGLDALYQSFADRGVGLKPPVDREFGMRELYVIDPHGNLLKFGHPVSG